MPYGDLTKQACQRFADDAGLDAYRCTIEEREEYEPHIVQDPSPTPELITSKSCARREKRQM